MFYDDNEWVALAKVQEYLQTGDRAALDRAKEIFTLVASGWDTDPTHAAPGGVFWTQAPWSQDRNTVSTFPGAQLATRLYLITHDETYLDWAKRSVEWAEDTLLAPNGLYWDNIKLDGSHRQDPVVVQPGHPDRHLHPALPGHGRPHLPGQGQGDREGVAGVLLRGDRLADQPIFFNSIYFKNLLLLESVTGGHTYRDAQQAYADSLWNDVRDPQTNLFLVLDESDSTTLLDQSAAVQIFATLAWPRGLASTLY